MPQRSSATFPLDHKLNSGGSSMPRPAEAVTAALSAATQVWKPRSELHSDSRLQPRRGRSAERQAECEHARWVPGSPLVWHWVLSSIHLSPIWNHPRAGAEDTVGERQARSVPSGNSKFSGGGSQQSHKHQLCLFTNV